MGRKPNNRWGKPGRYRDKPSRGCSPPISNLCTYITGADLVLTQQTPDCDDVNTLIEFSTDVYPLESGEAFRIVSWGRVVSTSYTASFGSGHCCDLQDFGNPFYGETQYLIDYDNDAMTGIFTAVASCSSQSFGYKIDITRSGALENVIVFGGICFYWDCNGFQTTSLVYGAGQDGFGYPCACADTTLIFKEQAPNQLVVDYTYSNDGPPILNWDDSIFGYSCEIKEGEMWEPFSGVFVPFDMNIHRQDTIILYNDNMGGGQGFGGSCDKYIDSDLHGNNTYDNSASLSLSLGPQGLMSMILQGGYGGGLVTDEEGNSYYAGQGCTAYSGFCPASCNDSITVYIDPTGDRPDCCVDSITFTWSHV